MAFERVPVEAVIQMLDNASSLAAKEERLFRYRCKAIVGYTYFKEGQHTADCKCKWPPCMERRTVN